MRSFTTAILFTALVMTPVAAQQAAAPAAPQNAWLKLCQRDARSNRDVCVTTQEVRAPSGQPLASVAIRDVAGEQRKVLLATVPTGMLIDPGVRLSIDDGDVTTAKFTLCAPNLCYAEAAIDNAFVQKLKTGGTLEVLTANQQAKPVRFPLRLAGFTSAYDGRATDPATVQARSRETQAQAEATATSFRDKLVAEQRRVVDEAAAQ